MNYTEANRMLTGRNQQSKKYANNTYLVRRGDNIALMYYCTDVVTFTPAGDIILDSGGWRTNTTKRRINQVIGGRLTQRNWMWYIDDTAFVDGSVVKADGSIEAN